MRTLTVTILAATLMGLPSAAPASSEQTGPAATSHAAAATNGRLAFASETGDALLSYDVFAANLDGSGRTNLTNAPDSDDNPSWSPDGTRIAFRAQRDGSDEIYVVNADGSGQTNLTKTGGSDEEEPSWSPDGTKIAFDSDVPGSPGNFDIFVMNANGTGRDNLTESPGGDFSPAWSPDGTKIAFVSDRDGDSEIYVMNADGSGQENLTDAPASNDYAPAWSPDGTRIAFGSGRDGNPEVYVMNADGSGQDNLSDDPGEDYSPAWAPDGTRIAFTSYRTGDYEIFVMNPTGSGQMNVTNRPGYDADPTWQPIPPDPSVSKGAAKEGKTVRFKIKIPAALSHLVTYEFEAKKGTAKRGKDFKKKKGTVMFAPGDTSETVKVKTKDDGAPEPNETFFLKVSFPGGPSDRGKAKIIDDD